MDDRLQKFAALVEAGTYTRAAANLHISQPALSVAVAKLERTLRRKLLQSTGRRGVVLTEAGQAVYASALEHRAVEQNLAQQLAAMGAEKAPLRIGMIDSVAVRVCAQDEPLGMLGSTTDLVLSVANSSSLRTALLAGKLDLAVVVADEQSDTKLSQVADTSDKLFFVCAAEKAAQYQHMLDAREQLPFISYLPTSKTSQVLHASLAEAGISVTTVLTSTSPDAMLMMAIRGQGAALLPENLVDDYLADGRLVRLHANGKPFEVARPLRIVKLRGRRLPQKAKSFIAFVTS